MLEIVISLLTAVFTIGAVWGAVKYTLKSLVDDTKEIKADVKEINVSVHNLDKRVAVLESKDDNFPPTGRHLVMVKPEA